jgi:hypothetical protein
MGPYFRGGAKPNSRQQKYMWLFRPGALRPFIREEQTVSKNYTAIMKFEANFFIFWTLVRLVYGFCDFTEVVPSVSLCDTDNGQSLATLTDLRTATPFNLPTSIHIFSFLALIALSLQRHSQNI